MWYDSNSSMASRQARRCRLRATGSRANKPEQPRGAVKAMWHVVFAESGRLPQSRAARSRDAAIKAACELLANSYDVRRIIEPNGMSIERAELDEHYDQGRFPGLRMTRRPEASALLGW